MRGRNARHKSMPDRAVRLAAGLGVASVLAVLSAVPAKAAECPPDRMILCRLLTTPSTPTTTTPPAQIVTIPTLPPVNVAPSPPPAPATFRSASEAAQRLLDLANGERAKAGLGRLTSRDDVVSIALAHSNRMATAGDIFHNDSYFTGSVQRLLNSQARGENVAHNSSVDDTHTRLMNSPGHRANILDGRFSVAGFAVVQAPDGRYFTTQNFMQPAGAVPTLAAAPAPAPAGRAPSAPRHPVSTAAPATTTSPPPATTNAPPPPVTAAPEPGDLTEQLTSLNLLSATSRAPAASAGPNLTDRQSPEAWVAAAALLALVSVGLIKVRRSLLRG